MFKCKDCGYVCKDFDSAQVHQRFTGHVIKKVVE